MDQLFLLGGLVIITDQMEQTMDDHPMKLFVKLGTIFNGILSDRVDADEKISGKNLSLAIVEGDNVCEVVMLEITHVDIEDVIIRTKYYVNIAQGPDFASGNELQPSVIRQFILENELYILAIIPYHGPKFPQIYNY
jgi:hypothetical protein